MVILLLGCAGPPGLAEFTRDVCVWKGRTEESGAAGSGSFCSQLALADEPCLSLYSCRDLHFPRHRTQTRLARDCLLLQACQNWEFELINLSLKGLDSEVIPTLVLNRCKSGANSTEGRVMRHKATVHVCEQVQLTEIKIMK